MPNMPTTLYRSRDDVMRAAKEAAVMLGNAERAAKRDGKSLWTDHDWADVCAALADRITQGRPVTDGMLEEALDVTRRVK